MKKYRAAVVGCGRIASLFALDQKRKGISTHAQAYGAHPQAELVAACDLDAERLADFGRQWGVRSLYQNFDEMLKKERIDLLSVCTWNASHAPLVEQAVEGGVKGIICEKPIADTLLQADRMIDLCRKKKVPLLINYTRRYVSLFQKIKKQLDSGELGAIQAVSAYYTAGTVNTGTHLFDFLRYFFGEVDWVFADPNKAIGQHDPSYSGYLHFKSGFGCTLSALDVSNYLIFEADIYGSKKRLRLTESGTQAQVWKAVPHPLFSGYKALAQDKALSGDLAEGLPGLLSNLISCVEKKALPLCSGEDGRGSFEIAAALKISYDQKGKKVELPLKNRKLSLLSK